LNVEVAAIRAEKMVQDIRDKAEKTVVFDGTIESKQTVCPECGKPTGEGKFCNNCGTNLQFKKCPVCGAKNSANTRFCGECGTRLK
jgi:membrane protease subunit (stomatin/prohibitin family)